MGLPKIKIWNTIKLLWLNFDRIRLQQIWLICAVKYYHNKLYKDVQQTGFHYNDMDQIWLWIVLKTIIVPYAAYAVVWCCVNSYRLILNFGNIEIDKKKCVILTVKSQFSVAGLRALRTLYMAASIDEPHIPASSVLNP